jgi:hypothetical protein
MTPRDIIPLDVVFVIFVCVSIVALWRIAMLLEGIRAILADIANASRATANATMDPQYQKAILSAAYKTERLLERALKKQWGREIDLS